MKLSDLVFETLNVFEDLGNLNAIDKELLKPFMGSSGYKKVPYDNGSDYRIKDRGNKIIQPSIGANSVITTVPNPKNGKDAIESLTKDGIGGVLKIGNKQVLTIAKVKPGSYNDPKVVYLKISVPELKEYTAGTEIYDKLNKKYYVGNAGFFGHTLSPSNVGAIISTIIKQAKAKGEDVSLLVIGSDKARAEKSKERKVASRGVQPVLTGDYNKNDKLAHAARNALRSRLDKFKGSNSKKFDTPMEALEELKKSGFADKITVNGIVYDLQDEQIRLSVLKGKDSWNKFAYVVYKRNQNDSRYDELKNKIWDYSRKNPDDKETIAKMDAMLPPREIKYVLGFNGASIVPTGQIEFSEDNW